ncbi:uncharacterized protein FA14DRAFT_44775 [Meira miltonrushii]|uniref:Uncharacterized protein n=1 Tax=Meira miltonrushii TaxID=1280837 RepID=A0A316VI00_9BASI|nr:uncharacterized protein FA14DRAFT_44775 [Meira miltonrushii]PWN35621.1 hypothetical protein FA14DRAFT_44775 [Meira miltonrushii]
MENEIDRAKSPRLSEIQQDDGVSRPTSPRLSYIQQDDGVFRPKSPRLSYIQQDDGVSRPKSPRLSYIQQDDGVSRPKSPRLSYIQQDDGVSRPKSPRISYVKHEDGVLRPKSPRFSYIKHDNDIANQAQENDNASQVESPIVSQKPPVFKNNQLPTFDNDYSDEDRPEDKPEYYGFLDKVGAPMPTLIEFNTDEFRNCAVWLCRNVATLEEHLIHPDRWTLCLLNHIKGHIGTSWADAYIWQFPKTRRFSTFWRRFLDRFTLVLPVKQAREHLVSLQYTSMTQFIGDIEKVRTAVGRMEEVEEIVREIMTDKLPGQVKNQITTRRIKKDPIDSLIKEIEQINVMFEHDQALLASTYQYLDKRESSYFPAILSPSWSNLVPFVSS